MSLHIQGRLGLVSESTICSSHLVDQKILKPLLAIKNNCLHIVQINDYNNNYILFLNLRIVCFIYAYNSQNILLINFFLQFVLSVILF